MTIPLPSHRLPQAHSRNINEITCILLFALFIAAFGNIAFWRQTFSLLSITAIDDLLLLTSIFIFIWSALTILFTLLLWKPLLKPILIILLIISAGVNYFCVTYGVYIDREMVQNAVQTNTHETLSLITPQLALWVFALGIVPAFILFKLPVRRIPSLLQNIGYRLLLIAICTAMIFAAVFPLYKEYASFFRNNKQITKLFIPTNYLYALFSFAKQNLQANQPFIQIGLDAKQTRPDTSSSTKPTLFILVVGETARAQNFSLFGYQRNTNPLLSQQDNILAFQNTSSCGTATAISVPCMFSNMTRESYSASQAQSQENLVDILQRAGVQVFWKNNSTGCQGVCLRVPNVSITDDPKNCPDGFCHDSFLLEDLDTYIAQHPQGDIFIVLHTIGSHGPSYYQRYPQNLQEQFQPACNTNQIQNCPTDTLVNVYDNTILYTDDVLNQTIELLKTYNTTYETGMLYISDHGESLGESGMYLHSAPYIIAPSEQTHVPMIFWSSAEFMQQRNINYTCMRERAQRNIYSQDNLFHTMLGLMYVTTSEYRPELDLFSDCKNP